MKKEELEQIKRNLYIEGKITKLKKKYSIDSYVDNIQDAEKIYNFLYDKITKEENVVLNPQECEYFYRACFIPLNDIEEEINKFDSGNIKMTELGFMDQYLGKKYNMELFTIIQRINDVRKIKEISKKEQKFSVLAVSSNKAFIVSKEKSELFINNKNSKKDNEFVKQMAETFKKNNLINDTTGLMKTKKNK